MRFMADDSLTIGYKILYMHNPNKLPVTYLWRGGTQIYITLATAEDRTHEIGYFSNFLLQYDTKLRLTITLSVYY